MHVSARARVSNAIRRGQAPAVRQSPPRLFDLWSRFYDQPLVQGAFYRPEQDAVLRGVMEQRPHAILDLGCGTGQLTERFAPERAADQLLAVMDGATPEDSGGFFAWEGAPIPF